MQLIECVPNFSEGQNMAVIRQITDTIESVEGVHLLDVDPGKATNRTVVTFVGTPEAVVEAAYLAIKKACEVIDMRSHKGEHPRMGATDVCPLIPIAGITMAETAEWARKLALRVGTELNLPTYLYEAAATSPERVNLANIRAGEYEGLPDKICQPEWKPDFGPASFNPKSGATVIGARDFLIAYNVNLNTTSVRRANSVAFDIREKGRVAVDPKTGKPLKNEAGEPCRQPGWLKGVKGIGWFIEEYGVAQVSMNITDTSKTTLHDAFEACCKSADQRGLRVTGSELVGLIPLKVIIDAGKHFLNKQNRSLGVSEEEIIKIAVKSMGLDELSPFDPNKKIIEYNIAAKSGGKLGPLVSKDLRSFANETASESPAPGGGSISAYVAALGAALATMVANLSSHKRGWEEQWKTFSDAAEQGQQLKDALLLAVDEDTAAFNAIMTAFSLPNSSPEEKLIRKKAIQDATKIAIEVPAKILRLAAETMPLVRQMVVAGNPNSITDAGVGALCIRAAIQGALLNVKINITGLDDKPFAETILSECQRLADNADKEEVEILQLINSKIKL